jgi:molybdate transport system substrate-binding protein
MSCDVLRRAVRACALAAFGFWLSPPDLGAQGLTVAAASDLQSVMPAIARQFEQASGQEVTLTFGSSGNFFSQIQNGAPFDLYFSADIEYPRRLEEEGRVDRGSIVTYAIGHLVLWTRGDSGVDVRNGLGVLLDARVRRIAIANPEHAPYGRAAVAALRHAGLYERLQTKLVLGENVSQAAQFVDSGNADAGIIALSLARDLALKGRGIFLQIPAAAHPPIEQAAGIVASSRRKAAARAFLEFIRTPEVVALLMSYGFEPPAPAGRVP